MSLDGLTGTRRVRKAFEQVYDQLRERILAGDLANGQRLPTELALAEHFGVSRGTVRESLRLLTNEGLIRTAKGAGGGSYVTLPTVDHVSEFLQRNFELLSLTDDVTLAEFLEARELIEVFAVRLAAARSTPEHVARLRETLLSDDSERSDHQRYLKNKEFHAVLVDVAGNTLLRIAAEPIFAVLHTHLMRSELDSEFPRTVCHEHEQMIDLIEAGDGDGAEAAMRAHLAFLGEKYRSIWRSGSAA